MRYFEMFAGVAGFGIGITRAYETTLRPKAVPTSGDGGRGGPNDDVGREGPQPRSEFLYVGFSEIDPHASAVLRYHYPETKNYGDCTQIQWSEVPDFDLLVGGSPCQDFSIAGKRAGLVGARSGLAYEYIRALEEKRPTHFIWENVRGVLSSNRGWDFAAILNQMAEAGYSLQWQVLNAKHFGVPQNRERVFVIGTRSDLGSPREIFFTARADREDTAKLERYGNSQDSKLSPTDGPSQTLSAGHYNQPKVKAEVPVLSMQSNAEDEGVPSLVRGPSESSDLYEMRQASTKTLPIQAVKTIRNGGQGSPHGSKQNWDSYEYEGKIRRLTPVECERLMSWPDNWTKTADYGDGPKEVSDTQRYKMCGNGVVSEVVAAIITQLYDQVPH